MPSKYNRTIVYIISAGHSGSTLLDKLLGQNSKIFSGGELINYNNNSISSDSLCSCGSSYKDCSFWSRISRNISVDSLYISKTLKSKNKLVNYLRFLIGLIFKKSFTYGQQRIINIFFQVYREIFMLSKKEIIIDSSKNFVSAIILSNFKKYNSKFIFLHRDGRAVLNSYQKKTYKVQTKSGVEIKERNIPAPEKIINQWLINNFYGLLLIVFRKNNTIKVAHESIVKSPLDELTRINNFLDISTEMSQLDFQRGDHIFGGNSSKINTKSIEIVDVDRWKQALNKDLLRKFNKKGYWMNKLLGYK